MIHSSIFIFLQWTGFNSRYKKPVLEIILPR
jgi:hypothetical protein